MKTWKRNAIIAAAVMLVCGGIYWNWQSGIAQRTPLVQTLDEEKILGEDTLVLATQEDSLEALANQQAQTDPTTDYFAQMRLSRQESRDSAVELLQETIAFAGAQEDVTASSTQLNQIVSYALAEAQIESLVIAKGYSDCVAYMTEDGITLAVPASADGLTEAEVACLSDIVTAQSDYELNQIRIVEVK